MPDCGHSIRGLEWQQCSESSRSPLGDVGAPSQEIECRSAAVRVRRQPTLCCRSPIRYQRPEAAIRQSPFWAGSRLRSTDSRTARRQAPPLNASQGGLHRHRHDLVPGRCRSRRQCVLERLQANADLRTGLRTILEGSCDVYGALSASRLWIQIARFEGEQNLFEGPVELAGEILELSPQGPVRRTRQGRRSYKERSTIPRSRVRTPRSAACTCPRRCADLRPMRVDVREQTLLC